MRSGRAGSGGERAARSAIGTHRKTASAARAIIRIAGVSVSRQPAQVFILNLQAGAVGTQPHRLIAVTPGEVAAQIRHAVHRCLPRRLPARQVQCAIDMQQTLLDAYTRLPRAERMQQHALL